MADRTVFPTENFRWPDERSWRVDVTGEACGVPFSADGACCTLPKGHRGVSHGLMGEWATVAEKLRRDRDELVAALDAALVLVDDLSSAYHDEGFEGACKGGVGAYSFCPNCQQRPRPIRAVLARIKAGG